MLAAVLATVLGPPSPPPPLEGPPHPHLSPYGRFCSRASAGETYPKSDLYFIPLGGRGGGDPSGSPPRPGASAGPRRVAGRQRCICHLSFVGSDHGKRISIVTSGFEKYQAVLRSSADTPCRSARIGFIGDGLTSQVFRTLVGANMSHYPGHRKQKFCAYYLDNASPITIPALKDN